MNNSDQHLRDILQKKLELHESAVDPSVWTAIQGAVGAGAASTATGSSWVVLKWIAAVVVTATTATLLIVNTGEEKVAIQPAAKPSVEAQKIPLPIENEPVSENSSEDEAMTSAHPVSAPQSADELNTEKKSATDESNPSPTVVVPSNPGKTAPVPTMAPEPTQPASELRGSPATPSPERTFDATFETMRVSENDLKFFFFPHYPDEASYSWTLDGAEISHDVSTSIAVSEGIHEIGLTVTSHKGKEHHSIQKVEAWLPGKLVVPNVFSPNSDDKNKCLDPTALSENIAVDKLFIYDGSGKELFESSEEQMCWDGNDRFGNPAPVGNYLWLVRFHDHSGKVIEQKGNLTLLRN